MTTRVLLAPLLMASLVMPFGAAHAGKLGVCKRCVTSSNVEVHLWTRDPSGGSLGFCEREGHTDGGEGHTDLCDAQAGVTRWNATNDPFWRCGINSSNHGAWIGGENDDLVVLSQNINNLNDGRFYRIQDGDGYRCGLDFFSGDNFSVLKRGSNRDIIDVWVRSGNGDFVHRTDSLLDGDHHVLIAGQNFAAVLFGNHKDILRIYGVRNNGTLNIWQAFINDGRDHIIQKLSATDFGITYGQRNDLNARFCFDGQNWNFAFLGIGQPFPPSCNLKLTATGGWQQIQ